MLVTFVAFESMAVATAMPTAVAELDGLAWYGWPFSAFLVASVVGMVLGGDLDDRRGSQVIVAINKDANAPIFEFSDLGVVGDVHDVVPKLTELVKQRKGS